MLKPFILLILVLSLSIVKAVQPWTCTLQCTTKNGVCGVYGVTCESDPDKCVHCSLNGRGATWCGDSAECKTSIYNYQNWIYAGIGVGGFIFLCCAYCCYRRRNRKLQERLMEKSIQSSQSVPTVTTFSYPQPQQNPIQNSVNTIPTNYQNQNQFYQQQQQLPPQITQQQYQPPQNQNYVNNQPQQAQQQQQHQNQQQHQQLQQQQQPPLESQQGKANQ